MYIRLKEDKQKEIINKAIKKAGSYRELSKILGIPRSSIVNYSNLSTIREDRFKKIICFLRINDKELMPYERLEKNWRQVIGGKNCVKVKKKKGTFESGLKLARENAALKLKEWHRLMKKNKPKEYYTIQYSRFKKVGHYKYSTKKGEKVRNILEKQVADILFDLNIPYEYEPLINIGKRYFFPDFLINNKIIIECTMWGGEIKAYKLKEKIKRLKKRYKVFVVIPKSLNRYYNLIKDNLVLGPEEFVPVAQTFLVLKAQEKEQ